MWIQVVSYIIQEDMPFLWPTIGYLSKTTALRELVCGILAIRFMCIVYAIILVPYVAAGFKELARMPKHICSAINGIYLLYIMVTECLREIPIMVPLYYLAFALICFLYMSVCMKCILMGLMEAFPLIYRLRNSLRIIFIFVWTSVSIAIIYVDVLRLMYIIQLRIFYVVSMVLLIFSAMGLGIYGLNRIDGDYYFLHNKHFFAIKNLKITLVFLLMISIAFIFEMYRTYNQSVYIFYMLALICLMPIPIGAFLNRKHGCNISPDWTPVHSTMKARRLFNTKNMYVYRQEKACMHVCLKNDERLKREIASML
ncbi:PREDICTED: uncharacterized protein LOC108565819 [Nicrophorus vespilloides]|uniref:Uncharacterized protein LOC108565819 n=1 Tax=Nicrophorus vespilloides TaxID=110193 RepID=A0ABM1N2E1_NICVS|nr:PREDICTED: uncharacterized protein LOC108565819 [Nicrophorus vespilloides]